MQTSLEFSILLNFRQCPYWLDLDKGGRAVPTGTLFMSTRHRGEEISTIYCFRGTGSWEVSYFCEPALGSVGWLQLLVIHDKGVSVTGFDEGMQHGQFYTVGGSI